MYENVYLYNDPGAIVCQLANDWLKPLLPKMLGIDHPSPSKQRKTQEPAIKKKAAVQANVPVPRLRVRLKQQPTARQSARRRKSKLVSLKVDDSSQDSYDEHSSGSDF